LKTFTLDVPSSFEIMMKRRSPIPTPLPAAERKGSTSKASSILNAHKPLPLSELFSGTEEEVHSFSDDPQKKRLRSLRLAVIMFALCLMLSVVLAMQRIKGPSTIWMTNPQLNDLLSKTPKTKDNRYTVFVTHSNGMETTSVYGQSDRSPMEALRRAYNKIRVRKDDTNYFIKVDAVTSVETVSKFKYTEESIPPLAGFAIGDWSSLVFLREKVVGSSLIDKDGRLRWDHIGKLWASLPGIKHWPKEIDYDDMTVSLDFIQTQAFFFDGAESYPLVKGRRVLSLHDLTPRYLRESANMAGDYLSRQTHEDGKMVYVYQPRSDAESNDEEYSLTRHAGTAYAMALLYRTYKNPELLKATQAALDFIVDVKITDCPLAYEKGETAKCVIDEIYHGHKWTQLGVNSLALLAMAEYMESTKDTARYWQISQDLTKWISGTQHEDGSFVQAQDIENNELDEDSYVRYFPGEAAFAIARLYNVASAMKLKVSESWKDVAARAMDYIVTRESKVEDDKFANDHWMMYALAEMSPWHWTKDMLKFALRTGRLAQERQIRHHDDELDQERNGVYTRPGIEGEDTQSLNSCATATKSEGLCAVYPVIQQRAPDSAKMFLDSVKWGIRYQLGTQMRPEQSIYMKKPWRVMGAMGKNIFDPTARNDYSQHNLSSFLCLARVLEIDRGDSVMTA
jgi:hypothetical protein